MAGRALDRSAGRRTSLLFVFNLGYNAPGHKVRRLRR
jgi:hypothetical protein